MKSPDVNEPQPSYGDAQADADAVIAGSLAALRRAAQRARELAEQTGTDLIVMRDGQLTRVTPRKKPDSSAGATQLPAVS